MCLVTVNFLLMLATLTLETVGAERKPKQPVLSLSSSSGQPSRTRLNALDVARTSSLKVGTLGNDRQCALL